MKLTEKEIQMFQGLGNSELGKTFVEYLERWIASLCDIRTLGDVSEEARKARLDLIGYIEKDLLSLIKLQNEGKETNNAQYL